MQGGQDKIISEVEIVVMTCEKEIYMRCKRLVIEGTRRGRGKSKKYWGKMIRHDMKYL